MNAVLPNTCTEAVVKKNEGIRTLLSFGLLPLSGFATDIYIPSLPNMGADLHVSSLQVQLTLTLFLVSYGLAQLFIGSFLDSYGRYRISLGALIVFTIASLMIALTLNIHLIYVMRMIQGVSIAIGIVAKRAYFVDVFKGKQLQDYLSLFTIIWSVGPIVAPFLGGFLQKNFGWQANFFLLAAIAFAIVVLELIFGGESLAFAMTFDLKRILRLYGEMVSTLSFLFGLLILCFTYAMIMVYNMTGPFIIEHQLHFSPVTAGYCSLVLGLAYMGGGFVSKATIRHHFYKKLVINTGLQLVVIIVMICSVVFVSNLTSLILFAFLIHMCAGYTYNNYFTYCLTRFPKNAGISGGLTGGTVYVLLSILTYGVVNFIPAKDENNLSYSYLIFSLLSAITLVAVFLFKQKHGESRVAHGSNK